MMNAFFSSRSSSSSGEREKEKETTAAPPSDNSNSSEVATEKPSAPTTSSSSTEATAAADDSKDRAPPAEVPKRPLLIRNHLSQPAPLPPAAPTVSASSIPSTNTSTENIIVQSQPQPSPQQQQQQQAPQNERQQQQQQAAPQSDSLSLAQLRRIVAEFPRNEGLAYDYTYTDQGPIEEEIDEWFMYNFWQWVRLNAANRAFTTAWSKLCSSETSWEEADDTLRQNMVKQLLHGIRNKQDNISRNEAIGALVYLVLGRWTETVTVKRVGMLNAVAEGKVKHAATKVQLDAMSEGVKYLAEVGGIEVLWDALREAFEPFWKTTTTTAAADEFGNGQQQNMQMAGEELIHLMTILYVCLQEALEEIEEEDEKEKEVWEGIRGKLRGLNPNLTHFLLQAVAKLRWDENGTLPQTQILLLFWKSILLVFGGMKEIEAAKKATAEVPPEENDKTLIRASPLDYHVFRQEITSKYPAYTPPRCVIPLESENTTLLPPLSNHSTRASLQNGVLPAPPGQSGGASILHQPVHIATPAPSPPPSPGVGGKGGKKQNYQTNQNFPFMYPPLDASSNSAGGKGIAGLQDLLVGRKWEGSDVPASIIEAGELFSKRVRMTRATRQLWDEREKFLKDDRSGWDDIVDEDLIEELDLSELTLEEKEELGLIKPGEAEAKRNAKSEVDYGPRGVDVDEDTKRRLDAVEEFYDDALPQLQSMVMVCIRQVIAIAANLQAVAQAQQGQGGGGGGGQQGNRQQQQQQGQNLGGGGRAKGPEPYSPSDAEFDDQRTREIAAKAATGIMILLLKWLKLSHILKFEYMTQLILDSNYIPLILKLFAMHDVQAIIENKLDRIEHSFFYFCGSRAGVIPHPAAMPNPTATEFEDVDASDDDELDDAAPPPIKRRRSPASPEGIIGNGPPEGPPPPAPVPQHARPEVDEMGYPVNPLPKEPITEFSRRNFFSVINYLRVLQKVCKHKAHRNLLLVHYKSSNILRKALKVPQPELRLYTLKLFKNQVPYCGRKWRQSNMRVITAIYLHCRPELRDEWLAGSDIDAEVEEALPLEQALRSLTHWFNFRQYPGKMMAISKEFREEALREEGDFFVRELEKYDLNWEGWLDVEYFQQQQQQQQGVMMDDGMMSIGSFGPAGMGWTGQGQQMTLEQQQQIMMMMEGQQQGGGGW
ncbi:hypothetical protein QBC38DRAFT_415069 [Podospora fimiseda]|uniref:Factor arrest protein 11 n=1 Tax=Podospora fimiseda TaxID=252190 RepID=A0AAN7H5F1_9PEZI|nr:hypothetical protein QBC38DRAFT_415069 [Podospora fimiseda]